MFKDVICFSFPFLLEVSAPASTMNLFINQKQIAPVNNFNSTCCMGKQYFLFLVNDNVLNVSSGKKCLYTKCSHLVTCDTLVYGILSDVLYFILKCVGDD